MLFDSHAHINMESYTDEDRQNLLSLIKNSDVKYIVDTAFDIESAKVAIKTANENDFVFASVGVHPHDVGSLDETVLDKIVELSKEKKVVAVGEIGLDYFSRENIPLVKKDIQKKWFKEFIRLAKKLKLPITIHDRNAHDDIYEILINEKAFNGAGVLLHCFSGDLDLAEKYIALGAMISIAGPVTFNNGKLMQEVAKNIPLKYLLIETDSPFLTPVPFRGKKNSPVNVKYIAEKIAELKKISYEEVAEVTCENAKEFFNIP
ncbi:MAG: TatD family hydrolase [Clostridiales Family XIII bacterium]|nr:TatD family hydrolase [Clostridiales Family XIII bacterium]